MRNKLAATFILAFLFVVSALRAQQLDDITSGGKLNPLQAIMDIRHYTLNLDIDIDHKVINGYAEIKLNLASPTDTLLFDLVHVLQVKKVLVDAKEQPFFQKNNQVLITGKLRFTAAPHTVRIYYGGTPPAAVNPPWQGGFTWRNDKNGNPWISINCQSEGGKIYFPCKDHPSDEPNEGADLFITIPSDLSVAGPGLLQSVKKGKNNRSVWHWKTNYTISNYCILFNIGKYKVFNKDYVTCEGNTVPIQLYMLEQDTTQAQNLLAMKVRDSRILEKYFGEYPWVNEKIGVAEVPNSGMEHQAMITAENNLKITPYPNQLGYSAVYFHEYAHEWWANKITNKDWAYMWIQEGLATYAEALAMKELGGEAAYDSAMTVYRVNTSGFRNKKPVVQGDEVNMRDAYAGDVYAKGALLMHTLRYVLGDSVFFPTLKKFAVGVKYPYDQFFTSDDVERFFIKETGKGLKPIFDMYLRTTKQIEINVYQKTPDTYTMSIDNAPISSLPLDIATNAGIVRTTMKATKENRFTIKSKTLPVVDPRGWYFRKIIFH